MKGHTALVRTIVFSADGTLLATTAEDKTGIVWDAVKGQLLAPLSCDQGRVLGVAFHPSGKRIAVAEGFPFQGNRDGAVRIIDWPSGKTLVTSHEPLGGAFSVAYSEDGRRSFWNNLGIVRLRDPRPGKSSKVYRATPTGFTRWRSPPTGAAC